MKTYVFALFSIISLQLAAQESEEIAVQKTIEAFFEGFHAQDSTKIKQTVANTIILQTIAKDKENSEFVKTENLGKFLKSIVSIPKTTKFQEKLLSFNIKVDGAMANAWTPYEFWVNDALSHCGVNSFQLFKQGADWKIIYLIDTRRKEGCQ